MEGKLGCLEERLEFSESTKQGEQWKMKEVVAALKQCSKTRDLQGGRKLHKDAVSAKYHTDKYVASALIYMYNKCGNTQCAQDVFDRITNRDVVSWNSLISGYAENGESSKAMDLFTTMDCEPDKCTFIAALKACGSLAMSKQYRKQYCLEKALAIHIRLRERGFESDVIVATSLVNMYRKCGSMERALDVFVRMTRRNAISWNCLILGYVEEGESSVAIDLFTSMDCEPNSVTFLAVLKACSYLATEKESEKHAYLEKGMAIHKLAKDLGADSDIMVATALVEMYIKCGCMQQAKILSDRTPRRDVVMFTCLVLGYVENGEFSVALDLFNTMDCEPDSAMFVAALKACAGLGRHRKQLSLEWGMAIHKRVVERRLNLDGLLGTTLVDMYTKCGSMQMARNGFDRMMCRDVVSWNSLILGYVDNGESSTALDLFMSMDCAPDSVTFVAALKACSVLGSDKQQSVLEKGMAIHKHVKSQGLDSDVAVANTLVNMYRKCGDMNMAESVFNGIINRNVVCWNCLILGYVENGDSLSAMELFMSMNCQPNSVTFAAALKACVGLTSLPDGQLVHGQICKRGLEHSETLISCLVDLYGKCSNMVIAEHMFNQVHSHDVVTWNALVSGYSMLGDTYRVFSLVMQMKEIDIQMDDITFTCILKACSHAGMLKEGSSHFNSMSAYGVCPTVEHYTCMIGMLGRENKLEDALSLVRGMPFAADEFVWRTLLGACTKWKNVEVGKAAFDVLVGRNPSDPAAYVMMRLIYEKLGLNGDLQKT